MAKKTTKTEPGSAEAKPAKIVKPKVVKEDSAAKKAAEPKPVKEKAAIKKTTEVAAETKPGKEKNTVKKATKTVGETKPVKGKSTTKKTKDFVSELRSIAEETSPATEEIPAVTEYKPVIPYSRFTDFDIALFKSGKHYKLYEKLGSHVEEHEGVVGTYFAVWAPNAKYVSVIANFNGWNKGSHPLYIRWDGSGIWEGFVPDVGVGEVYKYFINSHSGEDLEKSDPFALRWEVPPRTGSIVADTFYEWKDAKWMADRYQHNALGRPYSVYEVHLGSWARDFNKPDEFYTYEQLADMLVPYVKHMGFTHVEFMPVAEHPYYPSWGYQVSGYFAASSRYGTPQQLMLLIERFHQEGIGVIMDWVPSHFPGDAMALYNFDGTHLYEHADERKGFHPDWKSYIFNYGRNEVRAFLISNAIFWLDRYHVDGLRVDAVASMLYLDYSRKHGEWETNVFGGNENLEAISFLKEFNEACYAHFPDIQTIAEESTSFSGVSRPVFLGGLGFGMKWMMGWMHDTIKYFGEDPINRKYHHGVLTFSLLYAFTENFMLPFSHDEVVYGKGSMLRKMPGDEWQQFANLRLVYSYMFTHPGAKLLFMGTEFGQGTEWNYQTALQWYVTEFPNHRGISETVRSLNHLYKTEPALYEKAFSHEGFEWVDGGNAKDSVASFIRKGHDPANDLLIVLNMTPVPREDYRIGVPAAGFWKEIFNSDQLQFWGSGITNALPLQSEQINWHGKDNSISIFLPPLAASVFKRM